MNDRLGDIGFGDDGEVPTWAMDEPPTEKAAPPQKANGSPTGDSPNPFGDDDAGAGSGDIEMGEPSQPSYMETFFKDVDDIKSNVDAIRDATKRVGEINEEAVLATTSSKEDECSRQLKPLIDQTNKKAKRTKNLLALLKEDNVKLKDDKSVKASDLRIRENLCNTLTRKFIDEMKLYQNAQQKYKTDIKKKAKRQVQIVKPDATDADVDAIIRSEGGREELYRQQMLAGRVNDKIKNTYATVAGKYQDVLTLEASVAELHQMFLDFALLTEQQGELLDQIEFQVKSAGDYIEEANEQVVEAIVHQKKARKKQCIILVIVVVVAVVVLIGMGILRF